MSTHSSQVFYCTLYGSARDSVFTSDRDKQEFVHLLGSFKSSYGFKLYAFALLESQIHLLLCPVSRSIEDILSNIIATYARQFNKRNARTGYVFDDKYDIKKCNSDNRLLPLIRYIHHLPVQFGHCHHPNLARWTSHLAYLGDPRYEIVESTEMLSLLNQDKAQALKQYQALMAQSAADIYGAFVYDDETTANPQSITLELLADFVTATTGVSLNTMRSKGRAENVVAARRMLIAAAVMVCSFPVSDVAKFLNVHHSYVSRLTYPRSSASTEMQQTAKEMAASLAAAF